MFGIGSTELLVILLVGLIVLGPKSLASLSRTIGKVVGEFRRVSTDFQRTLNAEAAMEEAREKEKHAADKTESKASVKEQEASSVVQEAHNEEAANDTVKESKETNGKTQENAVFTGPPPNSPLAEALAKTRALADEEKAPEKTAETRS